MSIGSDSCVLGVGKLVAAMSGANSQLLPHAIRRYRDQVSQLLTRGELSDHWESNLILVNICSAAG